MCLQKVDLKTSKIGFGNLREVSLKGLAPKGAKRWPKAVQRLLENRSKDPSDWLRDAQGT